MLKYHQKKNNLTLQNSSKITTDSIISTFETLKEKYAILSNVIKIQIKIIWRTEHLKNAREI